jgi:hypothetical protein
MDNDSMKKRLCDVVIALMIAWCVLLAIAMVAFPGGYDFLGRPISSLGRTVENGQSNTVSLTFFTLAFLCYMPGLAILLLLVPMTLIGNPVGKRTSQLGILPGFCAIAFNVGVLLAPLDIAYGVHILTASLMFLCLGIMALFLSGATWKATGYPRLIPALWLLFFVLDISYAMVTALTDDAIPLYKTLECTTSHSSLVRASLSNFFKFCSP